MQEGMQMVKLRGGSKGLVRFYYLDEHRSCIRWRPSRKNEKAKSLSPKIAKGGATLGPWREPCLGAPRGPEVTRASMHLSTELGSLEAQSHQRRWSPGVSIDSIQEVSEGRQSEVFQRYPDGSFDPNCCFSIYHGSHRESLDLVSTSSEVARTWVTGLRYLMAGISDEDSLARRQRTRDQYPWALSRRGRPRDRPLAAGPWLKQTFDEADKNGDGSLSVGEVLRLLHKLNVNLPRQRVKQMFRPALPELEGPWQCFGATQSGQLPRRGHLASHPTAYGRWAGGGPLVSPLCSWVEVYSTSSRESGQGTWHRPCQVSALGIQGRRPNEAAAPSQAPSLIALKGVHWPGGAQSDARVTFPTWPSPNHPDDWSYENAAFS
ncbi:1-phosphatidylinositol 4,5-bisphosphate phosphodiesterase eta-2 [Saguinus oedipus]|uniref:1-phosphatidylinositol 4,5-bisphosphate phosphodiesterase eta-2 n=1 Tax=Saguinus oedipus TaxID=9490 RepID=A0ABQ9V8W7_SAGOE|nr:1-phosphatidylinositol 4,5-bisphosphate phosphodiesterase eta-2 [Saguinus oedipus]